MFSLTSTITTSNIINMFVGIFFGFLIMGALSVTIIKMKFSKTNKNKEIRSISKDAYNNFYNKENNTKDKIIKAIYYELKETSKLVYENKENALYELSVNDILGGILIIQEKLKKIVSNPLAKNIKNVHIATLIKFEGKVVKPVRVITKNKFLKVCISIFKVFISILNLINPIFYMKKFMKLVTLKKSGKDVIIIFLDLVGNTTYEIYMNSYNK